MKETFLNAVDKARYQVDPGTAALFYISTTRSILQHCAYAAVDYCYSRGRASVSFLPEIATRLLQPSDGDLPHSIDRLLQIIRDEGWSSCAPAWSRWQPPAALQGPLVTTSLSTAAYKFAQVRNDAFHDGFDQDSVDDALAWMPDFIRALLDGMADLMPRRVGDGDTLELEHPGGVLPVRSIRLAGGIPVVVRRIQRLGTIWRVDHKTLVPRGAAKHFFELEDSTPLIRALSERTEHYRQLHVPVDGGSWNPTIRLPQRQTSVFEGRTEEMHALAKWCDDVGLRSCTVYGEGGIGKTTLVLEFLHRLLEDPRASSWRPEIICFFSAKQTRWGAHGLERLDGILPTLEDAARLLARLYEDKLDPSYYKRGLRPLLSDIERQFAGLGLKRENVLLVLDNTETLAKLREDESRLAEDVNYIAARIARLIITSRRHEHFDGRSIKVKGMHANDGESLLRRLAVEYGAQALRTAGSSTLRALSQELRGSPLLIDVLARLLARENVSIERAMQRVLEKAADDLGTFLFQDAWNRIEPEAQQVFLTIAQLDSMVDGEVVGWACSQAKLPLVEFLDAFEETRFGSVHEYGSRFDLILNPGIREFLARAYSALDPTKRRDIDRIASNLQRKRRAVIEAGVAEAGDRAARAYASTPARTAKLAAARGDYDDAARWYELAAETDADNAALWDRFAQFMLQRGDRDRAWECAQRACAVDASDVEAHFTAGVIAAERGDVEHADALLERAAKLGRPAYHCALQKANARLQVLRRADRTTPKDRLKRLFDEAERELAHAGIATVATRSSSDRRHLDARDALATRIAELKSKLLRTRHKTTRRFSRS